MPKHINDLEINHVYRHNLFKGVNVINTPTERFLWHFINPKLGQIIEEEVTAKSAVIAKDWFILRLRTRVNLGETRGMQPMRHPVISITSGDGEDYARIQIPSRVTLLNLFFAINRGFLYHLRQKESETAVIAHIQEVTDWLSDSRKGVTPTCAEDYHGRITRLPVRSTCKEKLWGYSFEVYHQGDTHLLLRLVLPDGYCLNFLFSHTEVPMLIYQIGLALDEELRTDTERMLFAQKMVQNLPTIAGLY